MDFFNALKDDFRGTIDTPVGYNVTGVPSDFLLHNDHIVGIVAFIIFYYGYKALFRIRETPRLSFVTSLLSSTAAILGSTYYAIRAWEEGYSLEFMISDTRMTLFLSRFLQAAFFMDLAIGVIEYPKDIDAFSGWFHHLFYGLGLVLTIYRGFTMSFVVCLPCEIPTFQLALSKVHPRMHQDENFGITFFVYRVIYMLWVAFVLYRVRSWVALIPTLAYVAHVYWFQKWFKGYVKRWQEARKVA